MCYTNVLLAFLTTTNFSTTLVDCTLYMSVCLYVHLKKHSKFWFIKSLVTGVPLAFRDHHVEKPCTLPQQDKIFVIELFGFMHNPTAYTVIHCQGSCVSRLKITYWKYNKLHLFFPLNHSVLNLPQKLEGLGSFSLIQKEKSVYVLLCPYLALNVFILSHSHSSD